MYVILKLSTCEDIPLAAKEDHTRSPWVLLYRQNPSICRGNASKYTFAMKGKKKYTTYSSRLQEDA